jgi:hypothetical protein
LEPEIPTPKGAFEPEIPTPTPQTAPAFEPEIPTPTSQLNAENPTQTPKLESEITAVVESTSKTPTKEAPTKQGARGGAPGRGVVAEPPGFLEWYARFPRKDGGRAEAAKSYARALTKPGVTPVMLWDGLLRYRFSDDPSKIPMAQTWLNQGRWTCEYTAAPPAGQPRPLDPSKLTGAAAMLYRLRQGNAPDSDNHVPPTKAVAHG